MNTTRDSAVAQLKALREDIVSGKAKFEDLASRFSDCSSAKRGGDLGQFFVDSMFASIETPIKDKGLLIYGLAILDLLRYSLF
jgi:hypothetical protein